MVTYVPAEWHEFFVATAGAAAALTGLLFVAISINLDRILQYPELPVRAGATLAVLVSLLLAASFSLTPGQTARALGVEIACLGGVISALTVWAMVRQRREGETAAWNFQRIAIVVVPSIALLGGGVSLLVRAGGGMYWILGATVLGFIAAAINSWVLLVEVQR